MKEGDAELVVVRFYDGFDNYWIDVTGPLPWAEAMRIWNEKTNNGTIKAKFEDIDYYAIYPADSVMLHSTAGKEMWRRLRDEPWIN